MANLAFLGTGLLGSGFVQNLIQKGHTVRVWNRSRDKLAPLVKLGAVAGSDPADTVRGAERVHLVLIDDDAVDAVVAAAAPGLGRGVAVVDHSTTLPQRTARRYQALRQQGIRYVHAPVFMSPQNAREASGVMLLAATAADAEQLREPLSAMTGKLWHCGERPDLAAFHKLAGNAMLFAIAGIAGDVLAMGRNNGVDAAGVQALFQAFNPGAALPFFANRVAKAGDGAASFELAMARKDARLMLEAAPATGLTVLPAIAAAMDRALAQGHGSRDFAIFAKPAGS